VWFEVYIWKWFEEVEQCNTNLALFQLLKLKMSQKHLGRKPGRVSHLMSLKSSMNATLDFPVSVRSGRCVPLLDLLASGIIL
jgi:hypothetical protein